MSDTDHLQPPSAPEAQRQLSLAAQRATALPVALRDEWSPARCPAALLPWLAWSFGVEEWDSNWTDAQQRAAIAAALPIKRTKGTIGAVRSAVDSMGLSSQVVEWFNSVPAGDPYTFDLIVTVEQTEFNYAQYLRLRALVDRTKNVRSQLDELRIIVNSPAAAWVGCATLLGHDITVHRYGPNPDQHLLDGSWLLNGSVHLNNGA